MPFVHYNQLHDKQWTYMEKQMCKNIIMKPNVLLNEYEVTENKKSNNT